MRQGGLTFDAVCSLLKKKIHSEAQIGRLRCAAGNLCFFLLFIKEKRVNCVIFAS